MKVGFEVFLGVLKSQKFSPFALVALVFWRFILLVQMVFFFLIFGSRRAGLALLKFRERVVNDPFGALANWNDDVGVVNPCSWNGVDCSDGYVVSL